MNTSSSLRDSEVEVEPKRYLPIHGMSFRIGMPLSLSDTLVSVKPPRTTV